MSAFFPAQIAGQIIAFAVVTAFLFWFVLMIGIRHLGVAPTRQRALGAIIAVVLAVWYGIAVWTATLGVYKAEAAFLGIAVLVPIVVGWCYSPHAAIGGWSTLFPSIGLLGFTPCASFSASPFWPFMSWAKRRGWLRSQRATVTSSRAPLGALLPISPLAGNASPSAH